MGYRDIDRGIGDLMIITVLRDQTILCALLARHKPNPQQHLHDHA